MDEPQESIERDREASRTAEPEARLPSVTTESRSREEANTSEQPDPLPPNPFYQQPRAETEQPQTETEHHGALPTRTMNATPPPTAIPNAVAVTVRDSHGSEVTFKIKKHTKLNKLMDAFCERQGKTPAQVRFFFDGTRITGDDTPESVCLLHPHLASSLPTASKEIFPSSAKLFLF